MSEPLKTPLPPQAWQDWTAQEAEQLRQYRRWALLGFGISLLVHALSLPLLPEVVERLERSQSEIQWKPSFRALSISLAPDVTAAAPEPAPKVDTAEPVTPPQYREANPFANKERPDEPAFESFADQSAAQPDPVAGESSPIPNVEGTQATQKIVEAIRGPSAPVLPVGGDAPAELGEPQEADVVAAQQGPEAIPEMTTGRLSESEILLHSLEEHNHATTPLQPDSPTRLEGEPQSQVGPLAAARTSDSDQPLSVPEPVTVASEQPTFLETPQWLQRQSRDPAETTGQRRPQPRPSINQLVNAALTDNAFYADGVGDFAINSELTDYGLYLQAMMETIGTQWKLMGERHNWLRAEYGSQVFVRFVLNRHGQLESLEAVRTTASNPATLLVLEAIRSRVPYESWSQQMQETLGESTEIRIRFSYQ